MPLKELTIDVDGASVSAILQRPPRATALFVLAHGAGAGMRHPFMSATADALAAERIATLRFQFPYTEAGKKRPDPPARLGRTILAAVAEARRARLPLIAGGKSMGGRIASQCAARGALEGVRGLVFLGFPLHAAKKPDAKRAALLADVKLPMLFVQGARDALAEPTLLRPLVKRLGATLHEIPEGDHSFAVPKRTGRTAEEITTEVAGVVARWIARVVAG
jgi:predicted alpha/beta-hydrolase family hydrolase